MDNSDPINRLAARLARCTQETGFHVIIPVPGRFFWTKRRWTYRKITEEDPASQWSWSNKRGHLTWRWSTPGVIDALGGAAKAIPIIERAIARRYEEAGLIVDAIGRIDAMRAADDEIRLAIEAGRSAR